MYITALLANYDKQTATDQAGHREVTPPITQSNNFQKFVVPAVQHSRALLPRERGRPALLRAAGTGYPKYLLPNPCILVTTSSDYVP